MPSDKIKIHASTVSVTGLTQAANIFRSGRLLAEFTIRLKRAEIPEYLAPQRHYLYNTPKIFHYPLRYWLLCTFRHITHHNSRNGPWSSGRTSFTCTCVCSRYIYYRGQFYFYFYFLVNVLILLCNFKPRSMNSAFEFL
jgi:hypothetical protein